ncbi:MAG: homocysteine S-methyltransferase family protein [Victivallales bacterium]|nr:homocysteine S-methyltransferase family protein [Victivallales bacterium]
MDIREYLADNNVFLDGGTGTILQSRGLQPGEYPERWNISHPEEIIAIHRAYFEAGSNVVGSNTFGANTLKFQQDELERIIAAAFDNARAARETANAPQAKYIALDIGPLGKLLKPFGDFDFEEAVSVFANTVRLGVKNGADLVLLETMNDCYETKAALLAVKENCDLPVFVSNAYSEDGKLMTGACPAAMVAMLQGMGVDALGVNCSLGPKALMPVVREYLKYADVPVLFKPNAGMPSSVNGRTVFNVGSEEFGEDVAAMMQEGVRVAGGCCGTTPEYISQVVSRMRGKAPAPVAHHDYTMVSSYTKAVVFGASPVLIGERINPTGKKRLKQALRENDMGFILSEGLKQQEKGVHVLDVNVGLPEINETEMLLASVRELQAVIDLPLQIDTASPEAMEKALRYYNGKAMINSVNGKEESMKAIFPLVKKYGGLVVALTLDEKGIPETAEGRVAIARKILDTARQYGLDKKDLIFDTLAMTISADQNAANATLGAIAVIAGEMGCHTSLGVSNVSFGLPNRDLVNGTFFTMALSKGLSAAIMNPFSDEMMKAYFTYRALRGLDANCSDYMAFAANYAPATSAAQKPEAAPVTQEEGKSQLQHAIVKGLVKEAGAITATLLQSMEPMAIVQEDIIPALDIVGRGFEKKSVYLPQLLMSAEAASASFGKIKEKANVSNESTKPKCQVVLATVKGDIHDIGKNIVHLLLENYGFQVIDLGKDVAPQAILDKVLELHAPVAGLSALMTTTVGAMEETIALVHKNAPWCKVIVGGAVLTQEYADSIHADKYARDAMETVRICTAWSEHI